MSDKEKVLAKPKYVRCPHCDGVGKRTWYYGQGVSNYEQCDKCAGTGTVLEES